MATVLLFHSVLGLRPVELEVAEEWRGAGHDVVTPDLFDGRTAETCDGGFAILKDIGRQTVTERVLNARGRRNQTPAVFRSSPGRESGLRRWPAHRSSCMRQSLNPSTRRRYSMNGDPKTRERSWRSIATTVLVIISSILPFPIFQRRPAGRAGSGVLSS